MKFLRRTPIKIFLLYPLITLVFEVIVTRGAITFRPIFLLLMVWGYLQYGYCGRYRAKNGGGGPGLDKPP